MKWTALATSALFFFSTTLYPAPHTITQRPSGISHCDTQLAHTNILSVQNMVSQSNLAAEKPAFANPTYFIESIPLTLEQQTIIYNICQEYNVNYTLILAILKTESNFDVHSIHMNSNGTTDNGIAQINSAYYQTYAERAHIPLNEFDPHIFVHSIRALCGQISYLISYYQPKGYDPATLTVYVVNSYNMGLTGYAHYIKKNRCISRYYDQKVIGAKQIYDLAF